MLSGDISELIKITEINLYVWKGGTNETVFSVLHVHQTYTREQSLYFRDEGFMPCACTGIEL
jgi:hypothetical protein